MNDMKKLLLSARILILIVFVLVSVVFINPHYAKDGDTYALETNIEQGLDLRGGVRALLQPETVTVEIIQDCITKLNVRVNALGLTETKIYPVRDLSGNPKYIQVEMAGLTEMEMSELLEQQGKFEAKINRAVEIQNETGIFKLNGKEYTVHLFGDVLEINEQRVEINESFIFEDIMFEYINKTDTGVVLSGLVYHGEDVIDVLKDPQHTRIEPVGNGAYRFMFTVLLNKEGAERFAAITKDAGVSFTGIASGGDDYLDVNIDLYLDDNLVDSLKIGSGLKGRVETTIMISGPGESRDAAIKNMKNLQSILESGALPTKVSIVKIDTISSALGHEFVKTAIVAIFLAILAVGAVVFIRYRNLKIVASIILTCCSEVVILLGFASFVHWTIDLPAIAGILAAVGTGVDDQIIITDESGRKRNIQSLKQRLKNAFFIITTAYFTTVAAMLPLIQAGGGALKGFAITTIVGVTIGVLITRPAYGKVVEYIRKY